MATVIAGLGCSGMSVSATQYELLVYETGGHFRPHRDTETADGMFGVLSSPTVARLWLSGLANIPLTCCWREACVRSCRI